VLREEGVSAPDARQSFTITGSRRMMTVLAGKQSSRQSVKRSQPKSKTMAAKAKAKKIAVKKPAPKKKVAGKKK
jgi:hypothetical protein